MFFKSKDPRCNGSSALNIAGVMLILYFVLIDFDKISLMIDGVKKECFPGVTMLLHEGFPSKVFVVSFAFWLSLLNYAMPRID